MADTNKCSNLNALDPVQGLVDYVLDIKPFHTKIVEVLVEYVHTDHIEVTIEDMSHIQIDITRPAGTFDGWSCRDGYSARPFGDPNYTPIVNPDQSVGGNGILVPNQFTIPADRSGDHSPGTYIDIVAFIETRYDIVDVQDAACPCQMSVAGNAIAGCAIAGNSTTCIATVAYIDIDDPGANWSPTTEINVQGIDDIYTFQVSYFLYNAIPGVTRIFVDTSTSDISSSDFVIERDYGYDSGTYEVIGSTFSAGTIDQWPGFPNPTTYQIGIDPHTIVTIDHTFNIPTLGINQRYGTYTRLTPVEIVGVASNSFIVNGQYSRRFTQGVLFNVSGGAYSGTYTTIRSTYNSGDDTTHIRVTKTIDNITGAFGMIRELWLGYSEHSAFCDNVPEGIVRVKFEEYMSIDGIGLDLYDDVIVYNMENNNVGGYEIPLFTSVQSFEPIITETDAPPVAPYINDLWFNTTFSPLPSPYPRRTLHLWDGHDWQPITTAYWLDSDTNLLYYKTVTKYVSTPWTLFFATPPGYSDIQPAVGETELSGKEVWTTEEGQNVFDFNEVTYPINSIDSTNDYVRIIGDVRTGTVGMNLEVGVRYVEIVGAGGSDGTYTISNVVYISNEDASYVYVDGNLPVNSISGNITFKALEVTDNTLITVRVNGVVSSITLSSPSQFTITSPIPNTGDMITANVFSRTRQQTNANVAMYDTEPHQIFHGNIGIDVVANAYILPGGNYVRKLFSNTKLNVHNFNVDEFICDCQTSVAGNAIAGCAITAYNTVCGSPPLSMPPEPLVIQQPATFPIVDVSVGGDVIVINGVHDILFAPDRILTIRTSENDYFDYRITSSSNAGGQTMITVTPPIIVPVGNKGVVMGAVYDPNPGSNPRTFVFPNTPVLLGADAITYQWIGPLQMDVGLFPRTLATTSILDRIGTSDEVMGVPARYEIISTNRTTNTYTIHYDDPLTALPVDLTDSFPQGTIFTVTSSYNDTPGGEDTNNAQYVVLSSSFDGTDTIITIDTDYDNIPPYNTPTVLSMTDTSITFSGNLSDLVHRFNLDTNTGSFRLNQPLINASSSLYNVMTVTNVTYGPGTTTFDIDDVFINTTYTGPLGLVDVKYRASVYFDQGNVSGVWTDGFILREGLRIDQNTEGATATFISEDLDFGWGTTHQWEIINTNSLLDAIYIVGDMTGPLDPNDRASISGSSANDGEYEVDSYSYSAGTNETEIILKGPLLPLTDPPVGLMGVFQLEDIDITNWFQYLIKEANSTTNIFTLYGNAVGDIQDQQEFRVYGTTNDGIHKAVSAPIYDTNTNTTAVEVGNIDNDENGGWVESYRDYGIRLIFEDFIGITAVENSEAVLMLSGGSLIGAWDYNQWDVGSFDESVGTVIHLYSNTF